MQISCYPARMQQNMRVDVIIIGGGISGLWALNRLRAEGYQAILLESQALGAGQTLKSQGIIHGGLKYAISGALTGSADALESMPKRWKACLVNQGEIDLSDVALLSNDQLLWSTGSLSSDMTSFLASKSLSSRVQKLNPAEYPALLQHSQFKGQVYRLEEVVLNVASLLQALAHPHQEYIFKADPEMVFTQDARLSHLLIKTKDQILKVSAKRTLLTAGEGNEALATQLKHPEAQMQRRPLHMVLVKWQAPHPFFGHCMDKGLNPRITITSHPAQSGEWVWYLGGQIAEDGIHRSATEQIDFAKQEIKNLFPWLDLSTARWSSFRVNRAEAKQASGKRPDSFFIKSFENLMIAWPTKLALAPLLSDAILKELNDQQIMPTAQAIQLPIDLERPSIATPIWDEIFSDSF